MRSVPAALAAAALVLTAATSLHALPEPGPSGGCSIHIAGHPGVSLELLGGSFTPTGTVRIDYTIDGGDPHTTTVSTDDTGAFDLTIPTAPTFTGVYDFRITDPRCMLTPSAIARPPATCPPRRPRIRGRSPPC